MRIAIDARMMLDRPSGIGTYISELLKNLLLIDKTNSYFIFTNNKNLVCNTAGNAEVIEIKSRPVSVSEQFVIPGLLIANKIDVFHAPSFVVPFNCPCKTVITLHDLTHIIFKKEFPKRVQWYYNYILKHAAKRSSAIITDSNNSKNDIVKYFCINPGHIRTINLGVDRIYRKIDTEKIEIFKKRFNLSKIFILYNGSKKPHKNVELLLEAFHLSKKKSKIDCLLVITGRREKTDKETDFSTIDKKICSLRIEKDVICIGELSSEDLSLLYNAASVFVFPSLYEGFGLPPLEAMACGCPVVVSNISSLPEICGDAALYIDPHNVDSLCDGIQKILSDKNLRNMMIQKGLERVKSFSWDSCARKTLAVYEEVCNEISHSS
jgi:glycosyltransferase involved in cell wall biosynthesis